MPKTTTKIKSDRDGKVTLTRELLADLEPNTVYSVERQGKAIRLEPEPAPQSFWLTASSEEWIDAFDKWIDKNAGDYGLSLEAISRDSIYN